MQVPKVRRRSWFQILLAVGFVLVALPMGLAALLRSPAVREYARQEAERAIRSELGLSAVIHDVDIEPESLAIYARGITLDHPIHGRLVDAKILRIRPSWWSLLQGKIDLHTITIDKATVWLVVRDGKLINGPKTAPSAGGTGSVDLPFDKLWVKRSRLVVDAAPDASGELSDIHVYVDSTERQVLGIQLSSPGGHIKHRAGNDEVQKLVAHAKLTNENVQLDLLRLMSPEVGITVRNARVDFPFGSSYKGGFDLRVHVPQLLRWPLPVELPPMQGELRVQGNLMGDESGPRGDARVSLHDGRLDQYGFGEDVELAVTLEDKRIRFDGNSTVIRNGGSVDLVGSIGLGEGLPFEVKTRVNGVEFAKLMELLGISPNAIVDWKLHGNFELRGTLDPLDISGPLRMPTRDFRVMRDAWHAPSPRNVIAVQSANLVGRVNVKPKGITLYDIDVGMRHSKLHVQEVLLGFDNALRVRAVGEAFDLTDVSPLVDFPIDGRGGFDVQVDGTFTEPTVKGNVHFDDFAFATYPFGNIDSAFQLEKEVQAVRFPRMTAQKNESRYVAEDFVLDFSDGKLAIESKLRVERFLLSDFYHVFHYENDERWTPYQGVVRGDASVRYTLGFPEDGENGTMHADMDLDLADVELSGFRFERGQFEGSWHWLDHTEGYRGGELAVDRFVLRKGPGTVNISGKMLVGGMLDMVAIGDRISVRDTEGLSERAPDLVGHFGVTGTIKGDAATPLAELELSANGLTYAGSPLGDARTYVRLTTKDDPWVEAALAWTPGAPPEDEACANAREGLARGVWPADPPLITADGPEPALDKPMAYLICGEAFGGRVKLDLAVGRTRAYPLRGNLELVGFPFGKVLPRREKQAPLEGTISGLFRLRGGALLSPTALAGDLHLSAFEIGQLGVKLRNDGPIVANFAQGRFAFERAAFAGPGSVLQVKGGGTLERGLGLELVGDLDLSLLPTFAPSLHKASGRAELDFKISGPLDRPAVFGRARVTKGSVALDAVPFPVQNINGQVTFSAQRLLFDGWTADALGGSVRVNGAAALVGRSIGSYRFELEMNDLALTPREGVSLALGGQSVLSWKDGERLPKLVGTLRLSRARYTRGITMGRTLGDLGKKERKDVESYDPEKDLLALDLRIVQTEPMHVENNLIDALMTIDDEKEPFRLVGTDQRFGILGHMRIRRGTIRLRDRPFEIKEGEITFDSAVRVQPSFDVNAVTDVRRSATLGQVNWHIGVHAWGTPESFQFQLQSDPYLSEDDIALLLAVGMTHSELAQLQTSDLTGTAALEALATVTGVEREVQRALPAIDDVHIASAYSQRSNRTEPQLHIGKRIADRVRLDAATGLSESRDFRTGVEYQISDKTSVDAAYNNQTSTSASQLGDVGVDLKWRLEFD